MFGSAPASLHPIADNKVRAPEASAQSITLRFCGFNLGRKPHGDTSCSISKPEADATEESDGDGSVLVAGEAEKDGRGIAEEFAATSQKKK
jgi:hypothetical protein